ncbi:small-conductance mechanosensitive channel [Cylindrospermum stagnale PCC 7417]|uniref:Small-conductance mechanosensitive channel n=1 Tax=Cylindrospermum stagnale PCC 7417 TaxID=56107 RepID=K9X7U5_9NOST|nr:mechanosensitive ion channel domain-containing protein [Cylindrospermum stagnale]AFZ28179.1 small-conductance mechanosensitive channel [Cylindrospermum stagnale PCC 7417]
MNLLQINIKNWLFVDEGTRKFFILLGINFGLFLFFILLSLLIGKQTPRILSTIIRRFLPQTISKIYENLIVPLEKVLTVTGTLILITLSLNFIQQYAGFYQFLKFFLNLALIISFATLASGLFRQLLRVYGIDLLRKMGLEVDELLLVFETIANAMIGFIAALAFAQSQNINLIGLLAGLGIGGIAVAFAAQNTLEQLLGTIVLYLDRPFIPGEYIRVNLSSQGILFARVEAIGLRSTKLRTPAKSTLVIVPNSIMANADVENITRGKKVMVLLYLDFPRSLDKSEVALLEKVVKESTSTLFGIDPDSTKINLYPQEEQAGIRARVSFFILGSNENSIDFRKRLLELANEGISKKLIFYGIEFTMQEPTLYVDSNVTI